jgi:fumarylacetoacetate (FAA) hydrolase family protein
MMVTVVPRTTSVAEVDLGVTTEPNSTAWSNSGHCRPSSSPLPLDARTRRSRGHAFPDGAVLYLGIMFAPIDDRDAPGKGFTHKPDDVVTVASPMLATASPTDQCALGFRRRH